MRADRLLAILMRLSARGKLTACDLAKELEVSRRTILRDISALGMAGIPLYAEGGRNGGIRLDPTYRINLTGLTEAEAEALVRSFKKLPLEGQEHQQAAELGFLKLLAALPARQRQAVQRVQQRVHLDPVSWWQERVAPPSLEVLEQGIFEERQLHIRYERFDGTNSESTINPYGLVDKAGSWYLVARRDGEWRTYRVERMREAALLDTNFARIETFDLASHWRLQSERFESSVPRFRCSLSIVPDGMALLNTYFVGRFRITENQGDCIHVELRQTSLDEASMLVWGLGDLVIAAAPQELCNAVASRARKILSLLGTFSREL